jgi:hypothetical protein
MPRFQYRTATGGVAPTNEYSDFTQTGTDIASYEQVDGHMMLRQFGAPVSALMKGGGFNANPVIFQVGAGKIVANNIANAGVNAIAYNDLMQDIHLSGNDRRGYLVVDSSFAGGDLQIGINPNPTPSILLVRNFVGAVKLPAIASGTDGRCWTVINQRTPNDSGVSNGPTNVIAGTGVQVGDIDAAEVYQLKSGEAATFMAVYGGGGANWDSTGEVSRWVVIDKFVHAETP